MKQRSTGKAQRTPANQGTYLLDRLIVPRIESYAQNNDYTDIEAVADYLRGVYREYQRHKLGPFRSQVAKAVQFIQQKGGISKQEIELQAVEEQHLRSRLDGISTAGSDSGSSIPDSDASSGSSDAELDPDLGADLDQHVDNAVLHAANQQHMNSSLLSMYSSPAATLPSIPSTSDLVNQEASASQAAAIGVEAPAFAPPQVVEAAARRALAAERAQQHAIQTARKAPAEPVLDDSSPSTSGTPARTPVQTAAAHRPATPAQTTSPSSAAAPVDAVAERRASKPETGSQKRARRAAEDSSSDKAKDDAVKRSRTGGSRKLGSAVTGPRQVTYADLGGIDNVLSDIKELIEHPLQHPEVYAWLGVEPPRGVLLHGPPGCGKTALANAIANQCGVPFLRVSAPEIVSGMSGESEAKLRQLFQEATQVAPCIVFIDEIDAIAPKRETAQREMERRIVAQMLTCMDDLSAPPPSAQQEPAADAAAAAPELQPAADVQQDHLPSKHVVIIGATNRPDALDPALRRAGRFDREIAMGIPTEAARARILQVLSRRLRLSGDFNFHSIAKLTPGFVGADLAALLKEAAAIAVTRIFQQLDAPVPAQLSDAVEHHPLAQRAADAYAQPLAGAAQPSPQLTSGQSGPLTPAQLAPCAITQQDFETAVKKVQPSVRREGFATTPDVTWSDVGSLAEVREELSFAITQPIAHPEQYAAMGLGSATGVLLYGPPGCGKTLVAKAIANESGVNFISIKGPELLNKYVGESERAVRQLFTRARAAAPCVLFFDELDALAPRRGSDVNQSTERVVNQLLTEMDGTEGRQAVYLIAATNRPDMIDPALLRPGRLDKILYVPLPPPEGRGAILQALTRKTPLAVDVDVAAVGASPHCHGFSGADLAALVREACICALKENMASGSSLLSDIPLVHIHHFEQALQRVTPSVSKKDQRVYDALRWQLRSTRSHLNPQAAQHVGTENKITENNEANGVEVAGVSANGMGGTEDEGETKPMED
ncbi:TPA: hypothetical protein ACH3X2_001890 [Trebouxia sp. C0005]